MFKVDPFRSTWKQISIRDQKTDLLLYVDYDDVDHDAVDKALPRIVNALNKEFHGDV